VIVAPDRPFESLRWCRRAWQLHPEEGKYGYTYAFCLHQRRETQEAVAVLKDMVRRNVPYGDVYAMLAAIHLERGEWEEASSVYRSACVNRNLTQSERDNFRMMIRRLEQGP
jgi:predicted Zn-dependent protease